MIRLLDDYLTPRADARLLDVGCGTGTMLIHLKRYGSTFGVDMDHEAVKFCNERNLQTVAQATAGNLPFAEDAFDLLTMLDVLEHIPDQDGALAEANRVIRPGGFLMVAVPAYQFLWGAQDEVSQHRRRYTAQQLNSRIADAGLRVRRLTYFNTVLFPPIAAIRLFRRAVPKARSTVSDFNFPAPGPLNAVLGGIFGSESAILARINMPFGVSILCLAQKPV